MKETLVHVKAGMHSLGAVSAGSLAVVLVVSGPAGASANAAPDDADRTAAVVEALSPVAGGFVPPRIGAEGAHTSAAGTDATIPVDPGQAIELADALGAAPALTVDLPVEAVVSTGEIASDGTVVFPGRGDSADVAVQVGPDGSVRIHTVMPRREAGDTYTYTFGDGVTPVLEEDGGALLVAGDPAGVSAVVGEVAPPWAVDARGRIVQTTYTVHGDGLVQTVHPDEATVYPVVADPSVTVGTGIYVYFSKVETKGIAASPVTDKYKYVSALCALIPNPVAAAGCALYVYDSYDSVAATFVSAAKAGKRVEMKYTFGGVLVGWKAVA
jgi:hypothetical protein